MMEEKLPKGWSSNSLKDLLSFVIGGDWGKDPNDISEEDYVPVAVIRGSEIKNWRKDKGSTASIRIIKQNSLEKRNLIEGDILIEISGGGPDQPVGRVILIDEETLSKNSDLPKIGTNFLRLLRANQKLINAPFLNYYLSFFYLSGKVIEYQGGSNNLRNLKYKEFEKIQIPHPPLPEQQRIVAKLDAFFGHLDSLREKLDWIPTLLKNFRQQVLTQAVTGELTKEWREGKGLGEWEEKILEELIIEKPRNGYSPKGVEYVTEVKSLTLSATTKGYFDGSHIKYLDIEKPDMASHLWLKNGDILIQRSNSLEYVGTAAIYDGNDYEFIYPDLMMKLRANNLVETNYLFLVLSSNQTKDYFRKNATGTAGNMPKINQGTVMNTPIPYPSLIEQKEIISKVEALFSLADKIESQYTSLKAKIDQLPQAILAKAFRGELVGQEVKEYVVEEIGNKDSNF